MAKNEPTKAPEKSTPFANAGEELNNRTAGHKAAMTARDEQIALEEVDSKAHLRGPCVNSKKVQEKSKRHGHEMGICACGGIITETCEIGRKLTDCGTYAPAPKK